MTRKDYLLLSQALHPSNTQPCYAEGRAQHRADCEAIAKAIHDRNPRFDKARFLKDCGVST